MSRAVSRMDKKTVETSIGNIRKRLEKHFYGFTEASVDSDPHISKSDFHSLGINNHSSPLDTYSRGSLSCI